MDEGRWLITRHALTRCEQKGWTPEQVFEVVRDPDITYCTRHPGERRYIKGDLCAVVNTEALTVITVYLHGVETPLRPDQMEEPVPTTMYEIFGVPEEDDEGEDQHLIPLFQYRSSAEAKGVLGAILNSEDSVLQRQGIADFDDFRVEERTYTTPEERKREARAARGLSEDDEEDEAQDPQPAQTRKKDRSKAKTRKAPEGGKTARMAARRAKKK